MSNVNCEMLMIYPTDTVWGIGGTIESEKLCLSINMIKQVNKTKPFSILFSNFSEVKEYFDLKHLISDDDCRKLFSLETTLGIPRKFLKKKIGQWVYLESDVIGVRCLEKNFPVYQCCHIANGPIITTSLNHHGETPIVTSLAAKTFVKKNIEHSILFVDDINLKLSGNASSFIKLDDHSSGLVVRKGNNIDVISKIIRLHTA